MIVHPVTPVTPGETKYHVNYTQFKVRETQSQQRLHATCFGVNFTENASNDMYGLMTDPRIRSDVFF